MEMQRVSGKIQLILRQKRHNNDCGLRKKEIKENDHPRASELNSNGLQVILETS